MNNLKIDPLSRFNLGASADTVPIHKTTTVIKDSGNTTNSNNTTVVNIFCVDPGEKKRMHWIIGLTIVAGALYLMVAIGSAPASAIMHVVSIPLFKPIHDLVNIAGGF